jgi:photosystem II stability/assembly factor-like uncharacterized protein|tara:strand:- start:19 stop:333 length:315 start_codon:yes stop_codon:yes gene_type:complete
MVYVALSSLIIKTIDGGDNWNYPLLTYEYGFALLEEDETQSGHLYTAVNSTVLETEDGGLSWSDLQFPNNSFIGAILYEEENSALYIGTGFLYYSEPTGVFVYK